MSERLNTRDLEAYAAINMNPALRSMAREVLAYRELVDAVRVLLRADSSGGHEPEAWARGYNAALAVVTRLIDTRSGP